MKLKIELFLFAYIKAYIFAYVLAHSNAISIDYALAYPMLKYIYVLTAYIYLYSIAMLKQMLSNA